MLITRGNARPDIKDRLLGETALHKAVKYNAIDNVTTLIRCRAGVDVPDTATGDTALHKAAALPAVDRSIWNALLAAKAKTDVQNFDLLTPMDKAQRTNNTLAIALLKAGEQY
jgi:ankyrin repeat protein